LGQTGLMLRRRGRACGDYVTVNDDSASAIFAVEPVPSKDEGGGRHQHLDKP